MDIYITKVRQDDGGDWLVYDLDTGREEHAETLEKAQEIRKQWRKERR